MSRKALARNPYDWGSNRPAHQISRSSILDSVIETLLRGNGAILLGAHGTGKSVFLNQVEEKLKANRALKVLRFPSPPVTLTAETCVQRLARDLGVRPKPLDVRLIIEEFLKKSKGRFGAVALLYDETDQYTRTSGRSGQHVGRALFNALESARRDLGSRLGILAAGGLGLFSLRDAIGSPFPSRATWYDLPPFDENQLIELARPFSDRGTPLSNEIISELRLISGGNPALATYGLGCLWKKYTPVVGMVGDAFTGFSKDHPDFVRTFWRSLADPKTSDVPARILEHVFGHRGLAPRERLTVLCEDGKNPAQLNLDDSLRMLRAAGLIRIRGSEASDPLDIRPVSSLFTLPEQRPLAKKHKPNDPLAADIESILSDIHSLGVDFFRGIGSGRDIVPEAVFSASIAVALRAIGWTVEREAIHGAGRTDLKVSGPRHTGTAVVELKIWGRNDYSDIHFQVEKYWSKGVTRGYAIMISGSPPDQWKSKYIGTCLKKKTKRHSSVRTSVPGIERLVAESDGNGGKSIDHFLFHIPGA